MILSWASWMIWRCSLSELSTYFLSWKYKWFSCSSHLIREILLWYHASLQSASIIWIANLSLILICFHNVWVKVSAKSSSRFRVFWSSWDLMFSMLNSLISRFMKAKICESAEIIENRCNWTESKAMICNWSFITLMLKMSKARFSTILRFKIWVFRIVWCWYWCQESNVFLSLKRSSEWHVKAFNLSLILLK